MARGNWLAASALNNGQSEMCVIWLTFIVWAAKLNRAIALMIAPNSFTAFNSFLCFPELSSADSRELGDFRQSPVWNALLFALPDRHLGDDMLELAARFADDEGDIARFQ
jgi:hypothetical protein